MASKNNDAMMPDASCCEDLVELPCNEDSNSEVLDQKQGQPCMQGLNTGVGRGDEIEGHPVVSTGPQGRFKIISPASQKVFDKTRSATVRMLRRITGPNNMFAEVFNPVDLTIERDNTAKNCTFSKPPPVVAANHNKGKTSKAPKPVAASSSKMVKDADKNPETTGVNKPSRSKRNASRFDSKYPVAGSADKGKELGSKENPTRSLKYPL
ncbi:hypothetical protein CLU79DRAFT_834576 [Phycomyces nitens]|nr:hypothetical protein CLU79DRAFT_834576 [Phycomyces nitens]